MSESFFQSMHAHHVRRSRNEKREPMDAERYRKVFEGLFKIKTQGGAK